MSPIWCGATRKWIYAGLLPLLQGNISEGDLIKRQTYIVSTTITKLMYGNVDFIKGTAVHKQDRFGSFTNNNNYNNKYCYLNVFEWGCPAKSQKI